MCVSWCVGLLIRKLFVWKVCRSALQYLSCYTPKYRLDYISHITLLNFTIF